jgi:outer membrane receptor protein involved in Fe transport
MRKIGLLGTSALRSAALVALSVAVVTPAYAQTTGATQDDATTNQTEEEQGPLTSEVELQSGANANSGAQGERADEGTAITVTGSRIRRPNLESTVPITSIGGEQFFQQGDTNIGETLNELPQLRSTFSQQNPGLGIGIAGLNLLDLRGLGTLRTLVLVNGRRHVAADILNNAVSPDVNSIPNDLIERVDIVTGGNSAIYGSDAIAGVVNFVLRRNFDGIQIRGQAGVSDEGFGGNQYVSGMIGKNFGGDRGNITLHAEYAFQERVFGSELPWLRTVDSFGIIDQDPAGLPNGSDGFPDSIFSATSAVRRSTASAWSRSLSRRPAISAASASARAPAAPLRPAAFPTTAPSSSLPAAISSLRPAPASMPASSAASSAAMARLAARVSCSRSSPRWSVTTSTCSPTSPSAKRSSRSSKPSGTA